MTKGNDSGPEIRFKFGPFEVTGREAIGVLAGTVVAIGLLAAWAFAFDTVRAPHPRYTVEDYPSRTGTIE